MFYIITNLQKKPSVMISIRVAKWDSLILGESLAESNWIYVKESETNATHIPTINYSNSLYCNMPLRKEEKSQQ